MTKRTMTLCYIVLIGGTLKSPPVVGFIERVMKIDISDRLLSRMGVVIFCVALYSLISLVRDLRRSHPLGGNGGS